MFKNYIKIAIRKLFAQRLFTSINVFGLAVGFAGSLLISVFIWNELSYESMHKNRENIYRITLQYGREDESMILPGAMPALGPAAKMELPEVKEYVRIIPGRNVVIRIGDTDFEEKGLFFADASILDIFTIHMINKTDATPLSEPFDVLLSKSTAEKYFNRQDVIGEVIEYKDHLLEVSGVFEDIVGNTQIKPGLIASRKIIEIDFPNQKGWNTFGKDLTYLLVNENVSAEALEKNLTSLLVRNTNQQMTDMIRLIPEHFPDIHLNSKAIYDIVKHGNKSYVYLFSTIALFVLLVASLNFINLSTARSSSRAKEIGVKKVLGAKRNQLVAQFLTESLIITFCALVFGIILYELFYPILIKFLAIPIGIDYLKSIGFYIVVGVTFLTVGFLSGLYPAFYLTHFTPVRAVKNEVMKSYSGPGLRRVLVITQFIISILLIFGTTVIFRQLSYMQNYDIGMERENIVLLNFSPSEGNDRHTYETLKSELLISADVINVSGVHSLPGHKNIEKKSVQLKESPDNESKIMRYSGVDYSFLSTFGIKLVAGRNFSKEYSTDKNQAVILNEAAAREFGENNIVGKQIGSGDSYTKVIGVVKNFHIESLHNEVVPVILYINPERFYSIAVKISPNNVSKTLNFIEATWKEVVPGQKFQYDFMEDNYNALYSSEKKVSQLFTVFSLLALCIASLGLFGLASSSAEQKRKEVGIRKVLGSTVVDVLVLLSKDYLKMIIIASIISMPISYFLMTRWLQNFAYRIEISWWMYILAGGLALVIALFTVSWLVVRAATANPVESLRYE